MRSSILALAVAIAGVTAQQPSSSVEVVTTATPSSSLPQVSAVAGSLGLGAVCSETEQCASGADCYGTTAMTIKTCGSFNAACESDDQCATNTCQNGICSGFLASSLYKISSTATLSSPSSSTTAPTSATASPTLPEVSAAPGSLGLGAVCSSSDQCALGADCYGTTSMTIRTCGSFNAACETDDQCATNTCQSGICSGFLASSLYKITSTASTTPPSTAAASASVSVGTGSGFASATSAGNGTSVRTGSAAVASGSGAAVFTGGASAARGGVEAGVALFAAAFAWAL